MERMYLTGTAKVDITPPLTIPYLGYEPRHAFFHGVHDPLFARAVAFNDGATQAVIIAADSIGFSGALLGEGRNFVDEVRRRVHLRTGVPEGHIMLAASHVHSSPETLHLRRLLDTPAAGPWLEVWMDQLASAAAMAMKQAAPTTLKIGAGAVHGLAWNRRKGFLANQDAYPELPPTADERAALGPTDPQVGVIYLESQERRSNIVIANFACHPVTVQVQPYVSADFPGVAMAMVERVLPECANSLFLQGACGDQNPVRNTTDFDDVTRYGWMLGGEVVKMAGKLSADDYPVSPSRLAVSSQTVELAVRDLPLRAPIQEEYDEASSKLAAATTGEDKHQWARSQRMAEEALILIDRGAAPIAAEVQAMRLGDVAVVGIPGELFVELGLEIKRRSVAPFTFVVGYANDYVGYLTTPQAWQEGGYEVSLGSWTRVGPQGGRQLVETAVDLVGKLWSD